MVLARAIVVGTLLIFMGLRSGILMGGYIPISQVVETSDIVFEVGNLRRIDRQHAIIAQADNAPAVLSGDLFDAVREPIKAIQLPPGYAVEWMGAFGHSNEANAGLASQTPLEFMAILGIPPLTGMSIKNAIVLIDETVRQIANGKARMAAVVDAAVSVVRPVFLGVLTTVMGVVPLLWGPFFKSLAVVIICGLSFATIRTLIIVPALYTTFFCVKQEEHTST